MWGNVFVVRVYKYAPSGIYDTHVTILLTVSIESFNLSAE